MANQQFPLLRLPPSAVSYVLRRTNQISIISFSIISNRMKTAVKAINFTIPHMELMLGQQSCIKFRLPGTIRWVLRKENFAEWTGTDDINEPLFLCSGHFCVKVTYRKRGYTLKNWLDHFVEISKKTEFDVLYLSKPQEEINLDGLRQHIGSVRGIYLQRAYDLPFHENLLANFPTTKRFYVLLPANAERVSSKIVVPNFDLISIEHLNLVKLDDLLIMNAKVIQLNNTAFTDADINRFLKSWKTGSCSRLKILTIRLRRQSNLERILRGTGYQNAPAEREKTFEVYNVRSTESLEKTVVGGQDIREKNGRIGTVSVVQRRNITMELNFYVWE